eukprot:TRINITY_DN30186_c0_g1_i2.p1 TRINITY_DN30186_c0_g1~~TRINITY_DN30186_c0_g1_i2.p1  ORF type:complete len:358 (-),score=92.26 TRINITY_DN30186_c0_g1_i2:5-1078(-)
MGLVASVVQMVEALVGKIMHTLLMPKAAPAWYAGSKRLTAFPEAKADSLLLLGHVALQVPEAEVARRFFTEGLGACKGQEAANKTQSFCLGACQFQLRASSADDELAEVWPGHFYVWVEDSSQTLRCCRALEKSLGTAIVQEVINVQGAGSPDALVLQDPAGNNQFIVNQAPVGGMASKMRSVLPSEAKASNALAVIDATHAVAPGKAPGVIRFYSHFLGASMSKRKQGYGLDFSLGSSLHQTLTFVEDEEAEVSEGRRALPEVCIYVVSQELLRKAFERCLEAGILEGSATTWEAAREACEFRFSRCPDPASSDSIVIELRHVVRSPEHPAWPLPAEAQTRASAGSDQVAEARKEK